MVSALILSLGLFLGILLLMEVGRRHGARRLAADAEGARAGTGAVEGAVFALLGLLVAFTFSGAASRFEGRRRLVAEEANAIGTTWLRLDLLPASAQPAIRQHFRDYLDSRIALHRKLSDPDASREEEARSVRLQEKLWGEAIAASRAEPSQPATMLLLPALNQMFDITTTRTAARKEHPPTIIFGMLFLLALGCALLAGYGMAGGKTRSWIHMVGFAAVLAVTVYVILDIEYPRAGLIRIDSADEVLVELRKSMN